MTAPGIPADAGPMAIRVRSILASIPSIDPGYGFVHYLDDTLREIIIQENVRNYKFIEMLLVSADRSVSGDIVLQPTVTSFVDGTENVLEKVIVSVSGTPTLVQIPVTCDRVYGGRVTVSRLVEDPEDTLKDGEDSITATILTLAAGEYPL